jgi:DNA-binding response OmpR family regulator
MSYPAEGRALKILVAEDLSPIAEQLVEMIRALGGEAIGPVSSVASGVDRLEQEGPVHAAVLDVDLRGEPVYPLARALRERHVPIVFCTGYGRGVLGEEWGEVPILEKPFGMSEFASAVTAALAGYGEATPGDTSPGARSAPNDPQGLEDDSVRAEKNMRNLRMVFHIGARRSR